MKLSLENDQVVFSKGFVTLDKELELDFDFKNYTYKIGFGDFPKQVVNGHKVKFPKEALREEFITISVEQKNKATGAKETFNSKTLELTSFHVLGRPLNKMFPKALYELSSRIEELEERVKALESEGDII